MKSPASKNIPRNLDSQLPPVNEDILFKKNCLEHIKKDLKNNLSTFRYEHSLMVANEAKKLAHHYHIHEEQAYIAGLIHDIAHEFSDEENNYWINKYKLPNNILLPEYKKIIHSYIGAIIAKEHYNLDDNICNAINYHTIGNQKMNLLAKIIFVADKIARKNLSPEMEKVRQIAYKDINQALILCIENNAKKLKNQGKQLHPETIKLLQNLKNNK